MKIRGAAIRSSLGSRPIQSLIVPKEVQEVDADSVAPTEMDKTQVGWLINKDLGIREQKDIAISDAGSVRNLR